MGTASSDRKKNTANSSVQYNMSGCCTVPEHVCRRGWPHPLPRGLVVAGQAQVHEVVQGVQVRGTGVVAEPAHQLQ